MQVRDIPLHSVPSLTGNPEPLSPTLGASAETVWKGMAF